MFKQYRGESTALAADEYELQYIGKVNDIIPVRKYRSRKTGLRIVVAEVQGPLVNGYFCLGMCDHSRSSTVVIKQVTKIWQTDQACISGPGFI